MNRHAWQHVGGGLLVALLLVRLVWLARPQRPTSPPPASCCAWPIWISPQGLVCFDGMAHPPAPPGSKIDGKGQLAGRLPPAALAALGVPVDLNRADVAELASLPGIGPAKARAIFDDRQKNGPFATPAELERVVGVGPALGRRIEAHLIQTCRGGPTAPAWDRQ